VRDHSSNFPSGEKSSRPAFQRSQGYVSDVWNLVDAYILHWILSKDFEKCPYRQSPSTGGLRLIYFTLPLNCFLRLQDVDSMLCTMFTGEFDPAQDSEVSYASL
jgi:hypothetical protein